jgi:hypothetical protein
MRRQQSQVRPQRAHAIRLRRRREQHAVRALAVPHERFGHDLETKPAQDRAREELPVLAADTEVFREAADAGEDLALDQRIRVAEHVAEEAGGDRAAKKRPDLRGRVLGDRHRALKHVQEARQDVCAAVLRRSDERSHLGRRREIVVVHEHHVVAACGGDGRVPGGAEVAIGLAHEPPAPGGEFGLELIEIPDGVTLVAAVVHQHDFETRVVLLANRVERRIEELRAIAVGDANADERIATPRAGCGPAPP